MREYFDVSAKIILSFEYIGRTRTKIEIIVAITIKRLIQTYNEISPNPIVVIVIISKYTIS